MSELNVLFEDDHCLVVNKPAGIAVHPSNEGQTGTLAHLVAAYYDQTDQGYPVRHIHRLDEWTSGPVLYAKNAASQRVLDEAMRQKQIERIYIAFVSGRMKKKRGRLDFPIGRDRHHNQRRRVSATGDHAVTHYEVIEVYEGTTMVQLTLETGRTHQIRVHLSHIGHSLLGDKLYYGPMDLIQRQALHGGKLIFPHPVNGNKIHTEAPWPEDLNNLWNLLKKNKL